MADEQEQDIYASIIDDCRYSTSQEELLKHAKFAREDEIFPDEEPPFREPDDSRRKLEESSESVAKRGGEAVAGGGDNAGDENLGFRGERKRGREGESLEGMELEGNCGVEREIESQSKKSRVSPLIHCSGNVVIEGGNDREKVIAFSGELKVDIGSSSASIAVPEGPVFTEKLDSEGFEDGVGVEGECREESGVMKKLDFVMDTEVIIHKDDEQIRGENGEKGDGDKGEDEDHGRGGVRGDEEGGEDTSAREEDGTRRGRRTLPRSMTGVVWGEGSGDVFENENLEGGLKEISEEEKMDEEFKGSGENDTLKCIVDVLRAIVASEECPYDNSEFDIFETAKRRGLTFPRSRFLPVVEADE